MGPDYGDIDTPYKCGVNQVNMNQWTGLISTAFGIVYAIMSYTLPDASIGNPMEPKIFPLMLGIGVTICGILLIINESKKKSTAQEIKKERGKGLSHDSKLIIYTCVVAFIYALLFERIGYVLSTIIFMNAMLFVLNGKQKWKTNLIVSMTFSITIYLVFLKLLAIPLPMIPFLQI
ncbi:MAG: Tripartite tricarboxylate transporter TctB family [Anaerosolibacter sp.]|jgi:putative tricarboxylic transport membrane protein|uniref:tripartite tricarboxylate transporter TctB family protein n=1 Tax=Anaerosolibacter sp. TaxID=1872527 RepID=UPI00262586C2|nr:tripartite tricarboxylate transporter TctB family protein [Anaerosolibacter sp.]MDF2548860.1 Tripartite tricarboxylate transporter TctB family [Anaerosolibacter sp.]